MKLAFKIFLIISVLIITAVVAHMFFDCDKTMTPPPQLTSENLLSEGSIAIVETTGGELVDEQPVVHMPPLDTVTKNELYHAIADTTTDLMLVNIDNWKIYRNEEYGFELKYPANFNLSVHEHEEDDGVIVKFSNDGNTIFLSTLRDDVAVSNLNSTRSDPNVTRMMLNGIELFSMNPLGKTMVDIKFVKGNVRYSFGEGFGTYPDLRSEFTVMIDSFKFI